VTPLVLDALSASLKGALRKIAGASKVDPALIKEVSHDIEVALIRADVNVRLVREITKEIARKSLETEPKPGMSVREHVIKVVHDELATLLGEAHEVRLKRQRIMLVGLYGQGKTTTAGKLGKYFQTRGLKTALIAADVHRPAAIDQLSQLGAKLSVPVHFERGQKNAVKVVQDGLEKFLAYDVVIIDTAGRDALEDSLIREMEAIAKASQADEKLLVIDATVGQQAGPQAEAFHKAVGITGVIITKMDGSAKAGGALSAVAAVKAPVVFIGVGEKVDDLERFHPTRFIGRLLGMGDIEGILEKATEIASEEELEETGRELLSGKLTLRTFYHQLEIMSRMDESSMKTLFESLPGGMVAGMNAEAQRVSFEMVHKYRVILDSMTGEELDEPSIIRGSRIERIARGSGTSVNDVKGLMSRYEMLRKQMSAFRSNRRLRKQIMDMLGKGGGGEGGLGGLDLEELGGGRRRR
jgi:signal recognition particle subunit SRP54